MSIDLYPTTCNICGGKVVYCSNDAIYHGRTYGSGFCYLCTQCGAHVGTHKPHPRMALGLLADEPMRKGKKMCHDIFDSLWHKKNGPGDKRSRMYAYLSDLMSIPVEDCHFGCFDIHQLRQAYVILRKIDKMRDLLENHVPYKNIIETGEEYRAPVTAELDILIAQGKRTKSSFQCFLADKKTGKKQQVATCGYWSKNQNSIQFIWDASIKVIMAINKEGAAVR